MSEIIKTQINEAKEQIKILTGKTISDDRAFSHVLLRYFFDYDFIDQIDLVTDGANDGGIDFLAYDDEESKLIICQSKYTGTLTNDQIIAELNKMYSTIQNFKLSHTGSYNERLKKILQDALDRLPDEYADNIEYNVFTAASIDTLGAMKKINNTQHAFPSDAVTVYAVDQIEREILKSQTQVPTVKYDKIRIDKANNYLEYESDDLEGIQCNILSTSLTQLYNKYAGAGLFDLNIRRYIKNATVDSGINKSLDSDRENFWFLNNGIIIACTEYSVDGYTIHLNDFSIVNGGQTTTLIGNYKGTNNREFYIPCKIVATKDDSKAPFFFTKIAEATNSQKPIYPRDLKSNTPEMLRMQNWLRQEGVLLNIKRGDKQKGNYKYTIKNDELGQLLLSFVHQQPGTSRSGKKKIFETPIIYDKLYKVNYENDAQKKAFMKDIIVLNDKYTEIENKYKLSGLTAIQTEVLKNGKQALFALMGVCYRLANNDLTEQDLLENTKSVSTIPFNYGGMISNYKRDDLDQKIDRIIKNLVIIIADAYQNTFNNKQTTSVSNFLKTDQRYYNDIVSKYSQALEMLVGDDLKKCIDVFKRA